MPPKRDSDMLLLGPIDMFVFFGSFSFNRLFFFGSLFLCHFRKYSKTSFLSTIWLSTPRSYRLQSNIFVWHGRRSFTVFFLPPLVSSDIHFIRTRKHHVHWLYRFSLFAALLIPSVFFFSFNHIPCFHFMTFDITKLGVTHRRYNCVLTTNVFFPLSGYDEKDN